MTLSISPSVWVHLPSPQPQARLRLFCLPYEGGDASLFRSWTHLLPEDVARQIEICPLQLPGRAERRHEPAFTSIAELVATLVPDDVSRSPLFPYLEKDFAFCGVGLGGLLAFEIVHALTMRQTRGATALFVAAARAPHLPDPYDRTAVTRLSDAELIEHLRILGGTPEVILSNEKHIRLILPKIRADAALAASYEYLPHCPLDCPITVCGGRDDSWIRMGELSAWQAHTRRTFRVYTCAGDHFFVRDPSPSIRGQLLEYLARTLRAALALESAPVVSTHLYA